MTDKSFDCTICNTDRWELFAAYDKGRLMCCNLKDKAIGKDRLYNWDDEVWRERYDANHLAVMIGALIRYINNLEGKPETRLPQLADCNQGIVWIDALTPDMDIQHEIAIK